MKPLNQYINIRKGKSTIKATDETIKQIVKSELDKLGHDADLNYIDVSAVTGMDSVFSCLRFYGYDYLGQRYKDLNPDISKWDVSNVKKMNCMFYECYEFNSDISEWDVSNVEDMTNMFVNCRKFNQDLSMWDVSNVKDMTNMFFGDENFEGNGLDDWDVRKVTSMVNMFGDCTRFNCNLSRWETNSLQYMSGMFNNCKSFSCDLSRWDVQHIDFTSSIAPSFDFFIDITFKECPIPKKFYPKFKKPKKAFIV